MNEPEPQQTQSLLLFLQLAVAAAHGEDVVNRAGHSNDGEHDQSEKDGPLVLGGEANDCSENRHWKILCLC